jgi:hypothetical protein
MINHDAVLQNPELAVRLGTRLAIGTGGHLHPTTTAIGRSVSRDRASRRLYELFIVSNGQGHILEYGSA